MSLEFPHVAILGGGLLGGSLALALGAQRGASGGVRLWARRAETVESARALGIAGATGDLSEAVRGADLIVLAVPVGSMPDLVSRALAIGLPAGCVITDVGSVKRAPHQAIEPLLVESGCHFIGSHPMAGSERGGLEAGSAGLFQNAACLLTHGREIPAERAAALERFWQSVGCRTTWMDAGAHDELVARISHLPHLVAAAAAMVCLERPDDGAFGGGGLRDTTRVASGNPDMWAEIVTENREALAGPLRATIAGLSSILSILERGDQDAARQWLADAKHLRDQLLPPR